MNNTFAYLRYTVLGSKMSVEWPGVSGMWCKNWAVEKHYSFVTVDTSLLGIQKVCLKCCLNPTCKLCGKT